MQTKLSIATILLLLLASSFSWGQRRTEFISKIKEAPSIVIPDDAIKSGISGEMIVRVSLDEDGNVVSVDGLAGPGPVCRQVTRSDVVALRQVAQEAAKRAVFEPMVENGKRHRATGFVRFDIPAGNPKQHADLGSILKLGPLGAETTDGSENFLKRTAINLPKPEYPPAARAIQATGPVTIKLLIDETGDVFSAQAVSGHPLLRQSAAQTACKAKFRPTVSEGKPVKVEGLITFVFRP